MFSTILLAYDGSSASAPALRRAADIASRYGAKLHLLGIVHPSGSVAFAEATADDFGAMEKDHLRQAMDMAAIELRNAGLETIIEIRMGEPAGQIISYAREINADLAVLGHTEKGMLAHWLEGSVCARLLDHLPCDLLITKKDV